MLLLLLHIHKQVNTCVYTHPNTHLQNILYCKIDNNNF